MSAPTTTRLQLVGLREIAAMLEVQPRTPTMWRNRSLKGELVPPFPEPDGMISGNRPVWDRKRILAWAKATDRLPDRTKGSIPGRKEPLGRAS